MKKNIGDKIRNAREFRELDRTTFANKIGVKYRDVLRWETTNNTPRPEMLAKMADVLNIDIKYFFSDNNSDKLINYLSEDEAFKVTGMIEVLDERKKQTKECIDKITNVPHLKTACVLMTDLVEARLLLIVADVMKELSGFQSDEQIAYKNDDEKRQFIKEIFYLTDDYEKLRTMAKVLISFTAVINVTKQLGLLMEITDVHSEHSIGDSEKKE